jgi:membrane peptidoglycan carboxypeptidase
VWYGNSDSTSPNLGLLRYSLDNAGRTWAAFVRDYMNNKPAPSIRQPKGVVVGPGSELYIQGTQPGGPRQVDTTVPVITSPTPETSGSTGSGSDDDDTPRGPRRGGGNDDGPAPAPAPTCRPGFTSKPPGCTIPVG